MLGVSGSCAVLRFASASAAERARKRMENEDVLGHRIVVSFSPDGPEEEEERRLPAASSSVFLPVEKPRSPRRLRRASRSCQAGSHATERPYTPRKAGHASSCSPVMKPLPQVSCVPASARLPPHHPPIARFLFSCHSQCACVLPLDPACAARVPLLSVT